MTKPPHPIKTFISRLDLRFLAPVALLLAFAPFAPEPHLVEKLRMLSEGALGRPLDIFDLCMHGSGLVLVGARLIVGGEPSEESPDDDA